MAHHHDSDAPRVSALSELSDFEVAEGYPDIRGWNVTTADGTEVGKVHELIVDTSEMRTRYLDVRLKHGLVGTFDERDVLVPIGRARLLTEGDDRIIVDGLTADRFALLPAYTHGALTREHESELLRHFSVADAMVTTAGAAAAATTDRNFYDSDHFDDRRTFTAGRDNASRDNASRAREQASEQRLRDDERVVEHETARADHTVERVADRAADMTPDRSLADGDVLRVQPGDEIIIRRGAARDIRGEVR
jgi:photosynthetic reaction center H subunit